MDPNTLSVTQLKHMLRQCLLPTAGRKAELITRMQLADPSGAWMAEAAQQQIVEHNSEDSDQEEEAREVIPPVNDDLSQREIKLLSRERDIMQREIELLRRENDLLRASPRSSLSTVSRTTLNIKNVSDLLSEYNE